MLLDSRVQNAAGKYHQEITCKLKRDTKAKGDTFIKNKVVFNLLTNRVIKYLVLVDFLYPIILSDEA